MSLKRSLAAFLAVAGLASAAQALAARFPDVPEANVYGSMIDSLAESGLIDGNPDGKFYPDRKVNRAEMLKMLYKATGRVPDTASTGCFDDVEDGSWYESYVCDAVAHHFVVGYGDGTFRPGSAVNRVESIKMIMEVFGMNVPDVSAEAKEVVKFVDVSVSAWYTKYIYIAFVKGILPIPGQDTGRFYPDWPLLRGEAAAMIYNALNASIQEVRNPSSSSVPASSSSAASSVASSAAASSQAASTLQDVSFPFDVSGKFSGKKTFSYHFTLGSETMALTEVKLQSGQPGQVSCRLYLLEESGFSYEYFLGFQEGSTCTLKTALKKGEYQLQIQPTDSDTTFTVSSKETTGDGNDGFHEAQLLLRTVARTSTLMPGDYQDWYTFTVSKDLQMVVTASNSTELSCVVYPAADVTLSGFAGPECNQRYLYPPGTYYVAVGRKFPSDAKQTYTVVVQ